MGIDEGFKVVDYWIVGATVAGPILAIQAQKILERIQSERAKQNSIFETLMATRASRTSQRHVDALNAIPIVFHGNGLFFDRKRRARRQILAEWADYMSHMGNKGLRDANLDAWSAQSVPKFIALLFEISQFLGYPFAKKDLEDGIYLPEGLLALEADQQKVVWGFARIFDGKFALPIWVNNLPPPEKPETVEAPK